MAFKRCEYKDGETVITAENLNAMQDAICEMEGIIEIHHTDMNNPHKVTAEQVGAHPNTWMPTAEDVGARPDTWMPTAEEVGARPADWMPTIEDLDLDAAPASHLEDTNNPHKVTAEQVGARPNDWLPTIAEIGAAPAGYGLGGTGVWCTDCNTALANGWYYLSGSSCLNAPSEWNNMRYGLLTVASRDGKYINQIIKYGGCSAERHTTDGGTTWTPWDWINPPFVVGVEYRTTERWREQPVYAKTLYLGSAASDATIDISSFGVSRVLRYSGVLGRYTLPYINAYNLQASWTAYLAVSTTGIEIKCGSSLTGQEVCVTIWYTKS